MVVVMWCLSLHEKERGEIKVYYNLARVVERLSAPSLGWT